MRKQILSKDNISRYLTRAALPFAVKKVASVEEVEGGHNNFIFRAHLETPDGPPTVILKQGRPFLKRSWREGRIVSMEPERVAYEVAVVRYLDTLWGKGVVPEVYFLDTSNAIAIMEDVSQTARYLPDELEKGSVYPETGTVLGRLLGTLHAETRQKVPSLGDDGGYAKRVGKRLHRHFLIGASKHPIAKKAERIYELCCAVPQSLCWFDAVHRNIFVTDQGTVRLVDFQEVQPHDPAWDLGIVTSAWLIDRLKTDPKARAAANEFLENFEKSYREQWQQRGLTKEVDSIMARVPGYQGIYLLSRVDGKRGSYYSHDPVLEDSIRQTGLALLGQ